MISNGADTNRFRDIAANAARDVEHLFRFELAQAIAIQQWDYRKDAPRVVPAAAFAGRSLSMVQQSECVLAIFGPTVPRIASQEITRAFERRQAGDPLDFWLLLNPNQMGAPHKKFLQGITDRFGETIVYSKYRSALEFQSLAMRVIVAHVMKRLASRPTGGGGALA